jgi:hypothetical protein
VMRRSAVVRAVLGTPRHGDAIVVTGEYVRDPAVHNAWAPERPAACFDYLAAELEKDGAGRCDVADVLAWSACPGQPVVRAQLAGVLRRYPGCAVAAAGSRSGTCVIANRQGAVTSVVVGGNCPSGLCVLAGASFVHGWLCAGWPLAALNPHMWVAASPRWVGWRSHAQGSIVSCSLAMTGPKSAP